MDDVALVTLQGVTVVEKDVFMKGFGQPTAKAIVNVGPHVRSGRAIRAYSQNRGGGQGGLFASAGSGSSGPAKITADAAYGAPENSTFPDGTGYTVTLRYRGRKMTVPFYMGAAHTKEPTAHDVMTCVAADAASYENAEGDFQKWASEFYPESEMQDPEKMKPVKKTFRAVAKQTAKLKALLGEDYDEIIYKDEDELKQYAEGSSGSSGSSSPRPTANQPTTGAACTCRAGVERDNCPNCEGTGKVIDFAAIRAKKAVVLRVGGGETSAQV